MLEKETQTQIALFAADIRIQILRQIKRRGIGHLGGSMSIADLLSVLYGLEMKYDPRDPQMESRDWLICSKGHAGPAVYAALALKGFFPLEWLDTLNEPGTRLPSHCDRLKTPGIDVTTGSLGQGFSQAAGVALACLRLKQDNTVFCIVGDGECQEGQVWEAIMFAAQQRLDNLVLFIDKNGGQCDGSVEEINGLEPLEDRLSAFRWNVYRVDGHDYAALHEAIQGAKCRNGKPTAVIMDTIKGKGCAFAEGVYNHNISVSEAQGQETIAALEELKKKLKGAC